MPRKKMIFLVFLLTMFAGCNHDEITAYRVPKEDHSPQKLPGSPEEAPRAAAIHWKAPSDWKEQPVSAMRQGSFLISKNGLKADMSVISFPGTAGGDLANVNRWRGQLQLESITETEMTRSSTSLTVEENKVLLFDMVSKKLLEGQKNPSRLLGAILHRPDRSWFFKMLGDDSLVKEQKPSFIAFLKSVRIPDPKPSADAEQSPPAAASVSSNSGKKIHWQSPSQWKEQIPGGMRLGSFTIAREDRTADVSIISLPGTAGGILANINMWRSQLNLSSISDAQLDQIIKHTKVDGREAILVDMTSDSAVIDRKYQSKIMGAVIRNKNQTWFIKLMGEESLVSQEKSVFTEFLNSIRFSDEP